MSNLDYYDGGRLIRVPVAPSLPDGAITAADVEDDAVECPACEGHGEHGTHQNFWGQWDTEECRACDGMGEVTPEKAAEITADMAARESA